MSIGHTTYYMLVFNDLIYMVNLYKGTFIKCQDMKLRTLAELLQPVIADSCEWQVSSDKGAGLDQCWR